MVQCGDMPFQKLGEWSFVKKKRERERDVKFSSEYVTFEMPEKKSPGPSEYAKEEQNENIIPE